MGTPIEVTRDMLVEALTEFRLSVRTSPGRQEEGPVGRPEATAGVLHATLSRIAAERAPDRGSVRAASSETADQRIVSFDLMPKEPDYYFVLTEALREFAARQRAEAEDADNAESRIRWAETAEDALDQIEDALTPSTIQAIVAASIDEHGAAALAEQEARLSQPREIAGEEQGQCRG